MVRITEIWWDSSSNGIIDMDGYSTGQGGCVALHIKGRYTCPEVQYKVGSRFIQSVWAKIKRENTTG